MQHSSTATLDWDATNPARHVLWKGGKLQAEVWQRTVNNLPTNFWHGRIYFAGGNLTLTANENVNREEAKARVYAALAERGLI